MSGEKSEMDRELPPINKKVKLKKLPVKDKKLIMKISALVFGLVLLVVVILTLTSSPNGEIESKSQNEKLSILDVEHENMAKMSILDIEAESQEPLKRQDQGHEHERLMSENEVDHVLMQDVHNENSDPNFDFDLVLSDLNMVTERVDGFYSLLEGVRGQVSDTELQLSKRLDQYDNKVMELEEQVAYLVKEIKRLKWSKKQKRVARKKTEDLPVVTSFFVWQHRAGVELIYKESLGRFYEGDLLDGMRILKIDMVLKTVTLKRQDKVVMLKGEGI